MEEKGTEILLALGCLLISTFGVGLMAINLPHGITWGELFELIRRGKNKKGVAGFFMAWGGMLCFIAAMIICSYIKG